MNTRWEKPPSASVLAARARRLARADESINRTKWFISEVLDKTNTSLKMRVRIATEYLKSKVVKNISRPVTKTYFTKTFRVTGDDGKVRNKKFSGVHISDRSVKGEYPKADTVQLLKTIFGNVVETSPGVFAGYVGTPLDYGVILEIKMDRSFLVRTLKEERTTIMRILSGPL